MLVATGRTDWVRDVADEEGSVMEAVERGGVEPGNGVSFFLLPILSTRDFWCVDGLGANGLMVEVEAVCE